MAFFMLLPVLLALLLPYVFTDLASSLSGVFPAAVYIALLSTAALSLLMRQWHWLYSLSVLASHYVLLQQLQQTPLNAEHSAALAQFLPLLLSLLMLLLQYLSKPQLLSLSGVALLLALMLAPFSVLWLPLAKWQQALPLPDAFWQPVSAALLLSWGQAWWMALLASCWLALLSFYAANSQRWGQFMVWLAMMLCYVLLPRPDLTSWLTLAACIVLLLSLSHQMLQLAYIDELTQLPQRRALLNHLNRLGRRSAVTMLDVDHFKKFNDSYGHDVGDQVLKLLGAILASERGFSAYRYGGEEFTLVFSHNNADTLAQKLEQVRCRVAEYPLVIRQPQRPSDSKQGKQQRGHAAGSKTVHITISLGCAIRQHGENTQQLLKRADQALYQAKKAGRNQVALVK